MTEQHLINAKEILGEKVISILEKQKTNYHPCGSRVTMKNPRPDADWDFLVFVKNFDGAFLDELAAEGYFWEGSDHYKNVASTFMSLRNTDKNSNLIVTTSQEFADKHIYATRICKLLNLQEKADRISLFQAILYDNWDCSGKSIVHGGEIVRHTVDIQND